MKIVRIGLDFAKNVFSVCGVDEHGKVAVRKMLRRDQGNGVVCPGACGGCRDGSLFGAHDWATGVAEEIVAWNRP